MTTTTPAEPQEPTPVPDAAAAGSVSVDAAAVSVRSAHDEACACPGDGTDPFCNWSPSVVDVLALIEAAIRAEAPAPSMPPAVGLYVDVLARAMYGDKVLAGMSAPRLRVRWMTKTQRIAAEYARLVPAVAPVGDGLREELDRIEASLDPGFTVHYSLGHASAIHKVRRWLAAATEDPDHAESAPPDQRACLLAVNHQGPHRDSDGNEWSWYVPTGHHSPAATEDPDRAG